MTTDMIRLLPLLLLLALPAVYSAEPAYPLWDGHESVADYAKKVNLPPTKTLDLGNDVKMELVLIPAGKFVMGVAEPNPVEETRFRRQIFIAEVAAAVSVALMLFVLAKVVVRSVRSRRRPQISLALLLIFTLAGGGGLSSGLHWSKIARELELAQDKFAVEKTRFEGMREDWRAHPVTLTKPFYMGKFDVTQGQYQAVVGTNPSAFKGKDNPVESVSWDDARAFCEKLSEKTSYIVRLPTEAEWEYSCRAGTTTTYYSGDTKQELDLVAWYRWNSGDVTHPVGQKEPNALGLYDMHGNVLQWCQDFYGADYSWNSSAENPEGSANGEFHPMRGGSCISEPTSCDSAFRFRSSPNTLYKFVGFRIVAASRR